MTCSVGLGNTAAIIQFLERALEAQWSGIEFDDFVDALGERTLADLLRCSRERPSKAPHQSKFHELFTRMGRKCLAVCVTEWCSYIAEREAYQDEGFCPMCQQYTMISTIMLLRKVNDAAALPRRL